MKMKTAAAITGVSYLGLVMPRMFQRPKQGKKIYYAHRGLHYNAGNAPENTMAAFERAVKAGYGIELDVQLTRDGQVVVTHDFHLRRNCGIDKEVDECTYEELCQYPVFFSKERIPLFTDVLKLVDGKVPLIVELKYKDGSKICEKADEILQNYEGEYCIESFHPQVLLWYKKNRPWICRGQLSMNYQKEEGWHHPQYYIMRHLLLNFLTKPDFIAYDWKARKGISLWICRNLFRCPVYAWTIKSKEQLKAAEKYFDYFIFEGFRP